MILLFSPVVVLLLLSLFAGIFLYMLLGLTIGGALAYAVHRWTDYE